MPVLRKRETIRADYTSGGAVRARNMNVGQMAQNVAQQTAEAAYRYGQMMAQEAKETGLALARAAAITTDENGMPHLPPSAAEKMGTIARKTYDATVREQLAHHLTVAVRAQMAEAENANLYDFGGFQQEAQKRVDVLGKDMPPQMRSVFDAVVASEMASAAANIGRRTAELARQSREGEVPVIARNAAMEMRGQIIAANDQAAERIKASALDWIDRLNPAVTSEAQKARLRDEIVYNAGEARMLRDLDVENLSVSDLNALREKLTTGDDEKLKGYFTDTNGVVRYDMMARAANSLGNFYAKAQERATRARAVQKAESLVQQIHEGVAPNNKETQGVLARDIAARLGLVDESGKARTLHWSDWLVMKPEDRREAMTAIKDAGFPDESLIQLFRRLDRVEDPNEMRMAFDVLRDVAESPNSRGKVKNFLEHVPDKVQAIYGLASALHGSGTSFTNEDVATAMERINALHDSEWNPLDPSREKNDEYLYRAMREAGIGGKFNKSTARKRMHEEVNRRVFEDVQATPGEKEQAYKVFETYLATGEKWDNAIRMTKQQMKGRWAETKFMNVPRSSYAPELHYAEPAAETIGEAARRWGKKALGGTLHAIEDYSIISLFGKLTGMDANLPYSDVLSASPFEVMADKKIREMIQNDPAARDFSGVLDNDILASGLLKPGEDYVLTPNTRVGGEKPVYNVFLRGPRGTLIPLGELDVRDDWAEYEKRRQATETVANLAAKRKEKFLLSNDPLAGEVWELAITREMEGQVVDLDKIIEEVRARHAGDGK